MRHDLFGLRLGRHSEAAHALLAAGYGYTLRWLRRGPFDVGYYTISGPNATRRRYSSLWAAWKAIAP